MSQAAATKKRAVESKYVWFHSREGERLHFIPDAGTKSWEHQSFWEQAVEEGSVAALAICGLLADWSAPGFLSRMGMPRCSRCCRLLDIPQGAGTPFNWPKENGYNPPEMG